MKTSVRDGTLNSMNRRNFLKTIAASGALAATGSAGASFAATKTFRLIPAKTGFALGQNNAAQSDLWLYNNTCPGPLLRLPQGAILRADVTNKLDVATTIHWHGIRNINEMDGVSGLTQAPIEPGESFTYEFPVNDSGTYWYHAHNMSWEQVERGLYGPLIIDGNDDPVVDHDICLMLDDWRLDNNDLFHAASLGSLHDWSHGGRLGNWLTVNGKSDPEFQVKAGARVRIRLINAANARILRLRLTGADAHLIATDGAPCTPEPMQHVTLAPAQRADLICDMTHDVATLEEVSGRSAYAAGNFVKHSALGAATAPKTSLETRLPAIPSLADIRRIPIHMQGGAMGNLSSARFDGTEMSLRDLARKHKKLWAFNGNVGDNSHIFAEIKKGSLVSLDIYNDTAWPHAMHLHGHHFWVVSDDPTAELPSGQRDTWLMQPQERASLVFIADNPGLWLFHCHMLEHAASGMGAVLAID